MFVVTKPVYFSQEVEPSTAVFVVTEPSVFKDISKHVRSNQKGEDAPSRNIQLESVVLQNHR